MDINSTEEIKQRLEHTRVVAVTCLGITSPLLANKRFDVCIMDEAGQTTLPVHKLFTFCTVSTKKSEQCSSSVCILFIRQQSETLLVTEFIPFSARSFCVGHSTVTASFDIVLKCLS